MLGKSAPIPRRRVEIAYAAVPRGRDEPPGLVVVNAIEELAERRGSEAELGHADIRPAELARLQGREVHAAHASSPFQLRKARTGATLRARFRNGADSPWPPPLRCRGQPWSRRCLARAQRRRRRLCGARSS